MKFIETKATKKLLKLKKRIRAIAGGTSASKTVSILMIMIDVAQKSKSAGQVFSVVSESFPHLRKGAMKDFKDILVNHGYWQDELWNETNKQYSFPGGATIEFFSADQPGKVRGPRRDILFINECNNIPYETYTQLEVRTKRVIWLDWNPVSEFWYYEEMSGVTDHDFVTLTYLDNEALDGAIVDSIESRKEQKNWWLVYGLGQLGESEGRIYTGWKMIDKIPHEARLERYGLDFGFSNDPASLVAIYRYNQGFIINEIMHQKGLSNKQLADIIKNQDRQALVIADSAEPKSIDEMIGYGISIIGSVKGQGSVNFGIQFVQDQQISVTKRSLNVIKAYRNYLWETDKHTGKPVNKPSHLFSDAMDSTRYAIASMRYSDDIGEMPPDDTKLFDKSGLY